MNALPEDVLGHIVDELPYPVWYARPDGHREYFNSSWEALTGRSRDDDSGWGWFEFVHPGDRPSWKLIWDDARRRVRPYKARYRIAAAGGEWQWVTERARPLNDGKSWFGACNAEDLGVGREAEIRRLRRIYEAISQTNQAIVKLRDRRALLRRLCEIAVELGGFDTAWIAWREGRGDIFPVASAGGLNEDLLHLTEISEAAHSHEDDPLARLFARDQRVIVQVETDLAAHSPWFPVCTASGIRAIGAFPLREYGRLIGAFVLHTQNPDSFDEATLALLDEMAGDISFSLDIFQADKERREAERQLRRTRDRLWAVVTAAPLPILALDDEQRVEIWNPAAEDLFAWRADQVMGGPLPLVSANGDGLGESLKQLLAGEPVRHVEDQVLTRGGTPVPVRISGAPTSNGRGSITGLMALLEDLTDERDAASRERFARAVLDHSAEGIVVTDEAFRVTESNPAFESMIGRSAEELLGQPFPLLPGDDSEIPAAEIRARLQEDGHWQGELWHRPAGTDEPVPAWLSISRLPANGRHGTRFVALVADISELKAAEQRIEHLALHDPLTGLPNRKQLEERVETAVAEAVAQGREGALMFLDLDRFKVINDSLGHAVGDRLLCAVVERLRRELPADATFSRLGGDEFIILLPEADGEPGPDAIASHITHLFRQPFEVDDHQLTIRATVGLVGFPGGGHTLEKLLRKADAAMYTAKQQGRNKYQWFTREMNARAIERYRLETALRGARDGKELWVALQPQFSLPEGRLIAFEALLRWDHPGYGPIDPTRFVPLAEENGEIIPLGEWALENACAINRRLQESGLPSVPIAVNVSASQLHHPEIVETVQRALERSGLDPQWLELELTETMLLGQDEELVETLERFRALGIRLAIDDFGTGYSSMNYLKQFSVDKLKIDRTFVKDVHADHDSGAIVRAILGMAHGLRISVVAEGVETSEETAFLADAGCDAVQGFFFAPPMREGDVPGTLDDGQRHVDVRAQAGSRRSGKRAPDAD